MRLEISRSGIDAILAEAAAQPDREVCGLLLGHGTRVTHVIPCQNVAEDPKKSFEIDPAALIAAHRRARDGKPGVIGHYHSHPNGQLLPSRRDAESAADDGAIWLIVASGQLTQWVATKGGAIEGAFQHINCDLMPEGCTKVAPSPEGDNPYATYESHD